MSEYLPHHSLAHVRTLTLVWLGAEFNLSKSVPSN